MTFSLNEIVLLPWEGTVPSWPISEFLSLESCVAQAECPLPVKAPHAR
jgi:hypothetical protein